MGGGSQSESVAGLDRNAWRFWSGIRILRRLLHGARTHSHATRARVARHRELSEQNDADQHAADQLVQGSGQAHDGAARNDWGAEVRPESSGPVDSLQRILRLSTVGRSSEFGDRRGLHRTRHRASRRGTAADAGCDCVDWSVPYRVQRLEKQSLPRWNFWVSGVSINRGGEF